MSHSIYLNSIHWVHRPHNLRQQIDEYEDLCEKCVAKRVEELRRRFQQHAKEIMIDGGYEALRESDDLAYCVDCLAPLSCYLLSAWHAVDHWSESWRCIRTMGEWNRAERRIHRAER